MKDIILIYMICAPISMIGSLFIIITWLLYAKLKNSGSNFIFFQAISDFFFTSKYIITIIFYYINIPQFSDETSSTDTNPYCFSLGLFSQFFGQATIMWSYTMTVKVFHSYFEMKKKNNNNGSNNNSNSNIGGSNKQNSIDKTLKWYHLFVWGFCLVNATIIGISKQYGPSSTGCWIVGANNPYRFFELVPLYFTITTSIIILILILVKMKKSKPSSLLPTESMRYNQQAREFKIQLMKFVLIFIIFWLPATVLRTLEYFGIEKTFFILLDAVSVSLQALANSLVWATSPQFLKLMKRKVVNKPNKQMEREYLINK
ncbi:hypothetical protein ACTFIR_002365 [Dictyostelium discoideum]